MCKTEARKRREAKREVGKVKCPTICSRILLHFWFSQLLG
jgi:hypothetical protein